MTLYFWYPASISHMLIFQTCITMPSLCGNGIQIHGFVCVLSKPYGLSYIPAPHTSPFSWLSVLALWKCPAILGKDERQWWSEPRHAKSAIFQTLHPFVHPSHMNRHSRDQPSTTQIWRSLSHSIHVRENDKYWLFKVSEFEGGLFHSLNDKTNPKMCGQSFR